MYLKCIPLILAGLTLILFGCTVREKMTVPSQEISVTLLPDTHEIAGVTRTVIRSGGERHVSFTLSPGATVNQCTVNGRPVKFSFMDGVMSIDLSHSSNDGVINIETGYRCSFNDQPPADAISGEDPTYGVDGIVSRKGVFLGPGARWYPSPTVLPEKRTVRVNAPAGIEAVTAGKRTFRESTGMETKSVWEESHPVGSSTLSAAQYVIRETSLGAIPIYTYFTRENLGLAQRYLDSSAKYIKFYESLFGPYPFEKFAVVENFFPTGYGFPSYTLLGSSIINLPFIPDTSLPHEIAHSWWGNGVLTDERGGNWSEGLVTYLADYLLEEKKSPQAGRTYRSIVLSDYASLVTPDRDFPLREFSMRTDPASRCIGYGKGMMVFHMIRKMAGDEIFFRGLREICREKLYKHASWDDFLTKFSQMSGKSLKGFAEQWLNRGGGPGLSFSAVKTGKEGNKWIVTGEVTQTEPVYRLPLEIELQTKTGSDRQTLAVDARNTPFSFTVSSPPTRLLLDPDTELFHLLSKDEIPPTINRIKGSSSLHVVVTANYRGNRKSVDLLLESLGQQGAVKLTEEEATGRELAGHDLLFLGAPAKLRMFDLARGEGFTLEGESFTRSEDALFMVIRNPDVHERVAALFMPLSAEGASACVAKITHYGKYSYLAFSSGKNMLKGIEPVASESGTIDLSAVKE